MVDSAGNSHLVGSFLGTASFGSHILTSKGSYDVYAARLNSAGTFLSADSAGGNEVDSGWGIALGASGDSYVSGGFKGLRPSGTRP